MKSIQPNDCLALLADGYTYLDVRTPDEFEGGHPKGAFNVPVMMRGGSGMQPNPAFISVVISKFPKDSKLVIGCQSGMRSQRAYQELTNVGYSQLVNMECGYGGARDADGNETPGWHACGLPTESGKPDGRTYAELQSAKKRG